MTPPRIKVTRWVDAPFAADAGLQTFFVSPDEATPAELDAASNGAEARAWLAQDTETEEAA